MKVYLLPSILVFTACAVQPTQRELYENAEGRYARIYTSEQHLGNMFYYGMTKGDTVVFASAINVKMDSNNLAGLYVDMDGLKKIPGLIKDKDTLHFIYRLKTAPPLNGYIICGDGPPGTIRNSLYTYDSEPMEIKRRKNFIRFRSVNR